MEEEIAVADLPAGALRASRILYEDIQKHRYYIVKYQRDGRSDEELYVYVNGRNDYGLGMILFNVIASRKDGAWTEEEYNDDVTRKQVDDKAGGIQAHFYVLGGESASRSPNSPRNGQALLQQAMRAMRQAIEEEMRGQNEDALMRRNGLTIRVRSRRRRRPITRSRRRTIRQTERRTKRN